MFVYVSRGKKEWNCWPLSDIFPSRDLVLEIMVKMIKKKTIKIRDKTANATRVQVEFEKRK